MYHRQPVIHLQSSSEIQHTLCADENTHIKKSMISDDCHAWNLTSSIGYSNVKNAPRASAPSTVVTPKSMDRSQTTGLEDKALESDLTSISSSEDESDVPLTEGKRQKTRKKQNHKNKKPKVQTVNSGKSQTATSPQPTSSSGSARSSSNNPKPKNDFDFQYTGFSGERPEYTEWDVDRMRRWLILSSAMFYTYPHHDTAGLTTWVELLSGLKIWSYIVPKDRATDAKTASEQYTEMIAALNHISMDTENRLPALASVHNIFLFPGTLLYVRRTCSSH